jgi:integrase
MLTAQTDHSNSPLVEKAGEGFNMRFRVYKERGNRWAIYVKSVNIYCDKSHQSFYSKEHAESTLIQILGEIKQGTFDPDFYSKKRKSLYSFSVYAEQWLKNFEILVASGKRSPSTYNHYKSYIEKEFIPFFKNISMLDILPGLIKQYYLSIIELHPKTIYNKLACLHKIFADALDDGIIQMIPKFPIELKTNSLPEPVIKWADIDIQDLILEKLSSEVYPAIFFQMTHATRTGETRALQRKHIDIKRDEVLIEQAFVGTELRATKTNNSGLIPLDPEFKKIYLKMEKGFPEDFVFKKMSGRGKGKPFSESFLRKMWNKARDDAKVDKITLYEGTRHSLASQAVNRGVSIATIQKFLRHESPKMTQRYAHLKTETLRVAQRARVVDLQENARTLKNKGFNKK